MNFTAMVAGKSSAPLTVQFSDSEIFSAQPRNITIISSVSTIQSLNGEVDIAVTLKASPQLQPGNYTLVLTVSDGLVLRSVYLMLRVS